MFHLPLLNDELYFPPLENAHSSGLLAAGGDLSIHRLILAYSLGIFPWFDAHDPFLWWSPDPRFILFTEKFKLSKRQERYIKRANFYITANTAFSSVIKYCAHIPRGKKISLEQHRNTNSENNPNFENCGNDTNNGNNGNGVNSASSKNNGNNENSINSEQSENDENGTWITPDMVYAYEELFQEGFAHSVEVWQECKEESFNLFPTKTSPIKEIEEDGISEIHAFENYQNNNERQTNISSVFMIKNQTKYQLVGGLYGVRMGHVFCGESMFHLVPEASRAALAFLIRAMKKHNMPLLDSQQKTPHIAQMGGHEIQRKQYVQILQEGLRLQGTAHTSPFLV